MFSLVSPVHFEGKNYRLHLVSPPKEKRRENICFIDNSNRSVFLPVCYLALSIILDTNQNYGDMLSQPAPVEDEW
jgi:hypothetical protein